MADEQKGAGEAAEGKKKSKLPLFIILGVSLLVLGGGGFFAYTKFLAPPPVSVEEELAPAKPQEIINAVGEMFDLEQFVVNLSDPKGKRYLKVKITIELESVEVVERVTKVMPKLRDVVIIMLTSLTFEEVMTPEGKIQIRDELLERFNQTLRPDRVKNIYFTEFVVQ